MTQSRRPSPLQRRVLIVLAALDEKRPGPVLTRDIERVLEQSGEAPVYGPNLRASCRRLEDAGWLRTLRAPNLQLAVELTDAGRAVAQPLLLAEQDRLRAEQRAAEVVVLPLVPASGLPWGFCGTSRRQYLSAVMEQRRQGGTPGGRSAGSGAVAAGLS